MQYNFETGDVIASNSDPFSKDFFCGSIFSVASDQITVWYFGGGMRVIRDLSAVVPLAMIIKQYENVLIADKSYIFDPKGDLLPVGRRKFIGGAGVKKAYSEACCISIPGGSAYIRCENYISAAEALVFFNPCPHSRSL